MVTVQARAGTPDWAFECEAMLQIPVLHRAFRKGRMAPKLQESWKFGITCIFQAPTYCRGKMFSVDICIILPMFQPHGSSICRTSGGPSHVFNISPFLSVGWKMPLFSTIKSKGGYTHVSAVYHPLFPPFGQLTKDNDLYPWSICFI